MPVSLGWHNGERVYYITTDITDPPMARGAGVNLALSMRDAIPTYPKPPEQKDVLERVYKFPNGEQDAVFASIPNPVGPLSGDAHFSGGQSAYHIFLSELAAHLRSFVRRRFVNSPCSLTLSADHAWLFAASAGSDSVSVFRVKGALLELTDRVATESSETNSVAQFCSLIYVSNTTGSGSVVGFNFSGNAVASGSVAFSPDGQFLIVTEKATTNLDVFKVLSDGCVSQATITKSVGPGAFSAGFARNDWRWLRRPVLARRTHQPFPRISCKATYSGSGH
jgi:hypothetical protein